MPPPPDYLKPIYAPPIKVGDSIIVHAKQRGQIIKRQNTIITNARVWIEGVRQTYSVAPPTKNFFGF